MPGLELQPSFSCSVTQASPGLAWQAAASHERYPSRYDVMRGRNGGGEYGPLIAVGTWAVGVESP